MPKNKDLKKGKMSPSTVRKAANSRIWSERTQSIRIINENASLFVSQKNIKIIKLDETQKVATSFSTIVSSKGKIVID